MGLEVEVLKAGIGARVHLDKTTVADPKVGKELAALLARHVVLVLPQIDLSNDEQLALTDALGSRINISTRIAGREDADEVYQVTLNEGANIEKEYVFGTFFWHMDGLTIDIPPPRTTVLTARKLAAVGGHTEFANTKAAYEALSPEGKSELEDMRIVHTVTASLREILPPEALDESRRAMRHVHPLVWPHADGTRSLVIGSTADLIVGKDLPESRATLARLIEWTGQPAFTYRHYWQVGDCVIWDNLSALHRVVPYAEDSGRMMHRTTVAGTELDCVDDESMILERP